MSKKNIVYPFFLECCQYTNDVYWENLFIDLAYAKTPLFSYISKDFICYKNKTKNFTYKIEKKDPKKLYTEIHAFFSEKVGVFSPDDDTNKRIAFNDMEMSLKNNRSNWSDIRKKNIKELMIELYVIKMKNEHNLSLKTSRYLLSLILISLSFKVLTSKDIIYENNSIVRIKGIEFENDKVIFDKQLYTHIIDNVKTQTIVSNKKSIQDVISKYMKDIEK
jgi:hypothetical protein